MSKDIKEAAKQYAEIETKNVLKVRPTKERFAVARTLAERSFIVGAEYAFDCIISKFEELKKRVTVLKDVVYLDGVLAIIEGEKNQLTNKYHE